MKKSNSAPWTFGVVPYLNAIPLTATLKEHAPDCRLDRRPPVELAGALLEKQCDVALVPIADILAHPELEILADLGVAAEKRVGSVLILSSSPIEEIKTLLLDPESSTSNALARIILAKHYKRKVKFLTPDTAKGKPCDGELLIGDRALQRSGSTDWQYDLVSEWHAMTGQPFVFAAWATRRDHPNRQALADCVTAAWQSGRRALPLLAQVHATRLGLPIDRCVDYLTRLIHYELTATDHKAIATFHKQLKGL